MSILFYEKTLKTETFVPVTLRHYTTPIIRDNQCDREQQTDKTRIVRESDYSPASQLFCRVKKTMTGNYHKLDIVNIDAHTKFGLIMSIRSQDIERKRKSDLNKGP